MRRDITRPASVVLALILPALGWSQEPEDAPPPRYHVEAIVFEYADAYGRPTAMPNPLPENAVDLWPTESPELTGEIDAEDPDGAREEAEPPAFEPLADPELSLNDAVRRLRNDERYRVIAHVGWTQPEVEFGQPRPVRIHGIEQVQLPMDQPEETPRRYTDESFAVPEEIEAEEPTYRLDGWISFTSGRFNHFSVDLELREIVAVRASETREGELDTANQPALQPDADNATVYRFPSETRELQRVAAWRLEDRRRTRLAELQYFDSRPFGAITIAREIAPPEDANTLEQDPP